jgi:octanoyl-[GcvH]:protein N-octanoyltransferase
MTTGAIAAPALADAAWVVSADGRLGDIATGPSLLRRTTALATNPLVRIYRPRPVVAFGGSDRRSPGFDAAFDVAVQHGFMPMLRAPGGHAVAYHRQSLCVEFFAATDDPHRGMHERFEQIGGLFRVALARLGIDAQLGSVPDEYCPGKHSLNVDNRVKLVGTAQRIIKGGWMFGAGIVCERPTAIRDVLTDVYAALGLAFDPTSVAATQELSPIADTGALEAALLETLYEQLDVDHDRSQHLDHLLRP